MTENFLDYLSMKAFGRTASEARAAEECIRCRVHLSDLHYPTWADIDKREYALSALCPECWDTIMEVSESENRAMWGDR